MTVGPVKSAEMDSVDSPRPVRTAQKIAMHVPLFAVMEHVTCLRRARSAPKIVVIAQVFVMLWAPRFVVELVTPSLEQAPVQTT